MPSQEKPNARSILQFAFSSPNARWKVQIKNNHLSSECGPRMNPQCPTVARFSGKPLNPSTCLWPLISSVPVGNYPTSLSLSPSHKHNIHYFYFQITSISFEKIELSRCEHPQFPKPFSKLLTLIPFLQNHWVRYDVIPQCVPGYCSSYPLY
jgi:hypothetical protein